MQKKYAASPMPKKDYQCRSVFKNDSDEDIRSRYTKIWGKYISQQEESKRV